MPSGLPRRREAALWVSLRRPPLPKPMWVLPAKMPWDSPTPPFLGAFTENKKQRRLGAWPAKSSPDSLARGPVPTGAASPRPAPSSPRRRACALPRAEPHKGVGRPPTARSKRPPTPSEGEGSPGLQQRRPDGGRLAGTPPRPGGGRSSRSSRQAPDDDWCPVRLGPGAGRPGTPQRRCEQ